MNEFFVIYQVPTGLEVIRGSGPEGTARLQSLSPDKGVVVIPVDDYLAQTPLLEIDPGALRSSLWDFAKTVRTRIAIGGAATQWGVVDSSPIDLQNLQLKAGVAMFQKHLGDETPLRFTLKDNTAVSLYPDEILVLVGQALAFVDGVYEHARQLRAALDAAQTPQEVLGVDVFRGWPNAFPPEPEVT